VAGGLWRRTTVSIVENWFWVSALGFMVQRSAVLALVLSQLAVEGGCGGGGLGSD
jgi:hypothetical protein